MYFDFSSFSLPLIIISIVGGIACFLLASGKKRNPCLWLLLGIVFNIWALVILMLLPDGDLEDEVLQLKARVKSLEAGMKGEGPPSVKAQKQKAE